MEIHPAASVHPGAKIGLGVKIGAYATVGEHVQIGNHTLIDSHVVLDGWTEIGENCRFFPFASIGTEPQAVRYRGEATRLVIGSGNVIREFVTINRGTPEGGGVTVLGNENFIMAYTHIAHDCKIGNQVVMANNSTLGGHILVEDCAIIGGLVAIHQFVRIGCYSIVGGASAVAQDIPPYTTASGNRAKLYGLNLVGLRRHHFPAPTLSALKQAYRILFRSHLPLRKAIERVEQEVPALPEVGHLVEFLKNSKRGVCR